MVDGIVSINSTSYKRSNRKGPLADTVLNLWFPLILLLIKEATKMVILKQFLFLQFPLILLLIKEATGNLGTKKIQPTRFH